MTAGWRSPTAGHRSDRQPRGEPVDWDEAYREHRGPEASIAEAKAVAGPEPEPETATHDH